MEIQVVSNINSLCNINAQSKESMLFHKICKQIAFSSPTCVIYLRVTDQYMVDDKFMNNQIDV